MKRIFTFGLLVAAAFALTNCAQKESYAPVQEETQNNIPFELVVKLPAETKTVNDGLHTKWSTPDTIKVSFVSRVSWLPYSSTAEFTSDTGDGILRGSFSGKVGDFFAHINLADIQAYYPYTSNGVPASTVQDGYNSMAHLSGANCPLYGELSKTDLNSTGNNGATTTDPIILEHTTSVIEVAVKNSTTAAIEVNKVDFLVGGEVKATTVVENAGALAAGETAFVYVVVEPGTYSDLSFTVNDKFVKDINAAEATFTAGLIKKVNFEVK